MKSDSARSGAVTVICATRNATEAVQLTLSSFRRYTPEECEVLVADNGSSDGTLEYLRSLPWMTVMSLDERRAASSSATHMIPPSLSTEHGCTLDWLASQVSTPFLLTLDSDVEFLRSGWLSQLLALVEAESLDALGDYEPGFDDTYRPRLAPYLLLIRTEVFRSLGASLAGYTISLSSDEAARLEQLPEHFCLRPEDLRNYPYSVFYSTGARFFEMLVGHGARWKTFPNSVKESFRHLGHMSWGAENHAPALIAQHRSETLSYLRSREYAWQPSTGRKRP